MPSLPTTSSNAPFSPTGATRRGPRIGPLTPHLYVPTAGRPLRAKRSDLAPDTHVVPHAHPWAQLAYSAAGVIRVTVERGTFLVPPSRALWIPPGVEHAVTVVEGCELRTLYLHQHAQHCGPRAAFAAPPMSTAAAETPMVDAADWSHCRVIEVTGLLRALAIALPTEPDSQPARADDLQREQLIAPLLIDELCRARPVPLGVPLPADKRLRALCEAILDDPARHATLEDWSRDAGASARTVARLFRTELDTSFGQWRQQALLARAMTLAARGRAMNQIAADLGYASASAFTAMVRRSVGAPPSRFFASV